MSKDGVEREKARRGKAKDNGGEAPADERKAGPELDAAHEKEVLHNLSGTVLSGFARVYEIEQEIASETAQHIQPLREQRKDACAALRTDSGMQREELAPYFAIYSRARSIDDFEDQEAAAILKDNLRRLYQALPTGSTMNFLDVIEGAAAPGEPPRSAKREGEKDYGRGVRFDQCPYKGDKPGDIVNREAWQQGFLAAKETWDKAAPPSAPKEPPAEAVQH